MKRRTKAQIERDNYIMEVGRYNFFVIDRDNDYRVVTGYEYKDDALEVTLDIENSVVMSTAQAKRQGIDTRAAQQRWINNAFENCK